jgi:hypothetical protein
VSTSTRQRRHLNPPPAAGLRQGAVLSSVLFTLYIADMPYPPNTSLALYADDTAILAQSLRTDTIARRLSQATSVLQRYFNRWKLRVNIHKTDAILFTRRRPATPIPLRFQHARIPWKSQIHYLGLLLDHKLLFTKHLTNVTHKVTGSMVKLFPLLARDSTLSAQNKLILYKLSIRSVMTYSAPVWSNTSPSNYRRLQTLQSNFPRCTPIPLLHTTFNVLPIHDHIHYMTALPPFTQTPLYVSSETTPYEISISNTKSTSINEQNISYSTYLLRTTCSSVFSIL